VADDVVPRHDDVADVDPRPQPQRRWLRLDQFEAAQRGGFGFGEGEEQTVAQALDRATAAATDNRSDNAVVMRQQVAGRFVALLLGEAGEPLEVREHDRDRRRSPALSRRFLGGGSQGLDGGESEPRQQRRALLDRPLEQSLDDGDGRRVGEDGPLALIAKITAHDSDFHEP